MLKSLLKRGNKPDFLISIISHFQTSIKNNQLCKRNRHQLMFYNRIQTSRIIIHNPPHLNLTIQISHLLKEEMLRNQLQNNNWKLQFSNSNNKTSCNNHRLLKNHIQWDREVLWMKEAVVSIVISQAFKLITINHLQQTTTTCMVVNKEMRIFYVLF